MTVLLAGACAAVIFAQGGGDVISKRNDLERLRGAIRESEERMKRLDGEARRSAEAIEEYRRQTLALDSLVTVLQGEEGRLASEMIEVRRRRDSLSDELSALRASYGRMAKALFRHRLLTTSASVLLLPKEHERLAMRQHLFGRYARAQRRRAVRIADVAGALAGHDSLLRSRQAEQLAVIGEKRAEMERLFDLQRAGAASLQQTSSARSALKAEIERKNAEAGKISDMIARLAREDDRASQTSRPARSQTDASSRAGGRGDGAGAGRSLSGKNAAGLAPNGGGRAPAGRESRTKAGDRSGAARMPDGDKPNAKRPAGKVRFVWPTTGRRIVEGYGERVNPETGTVTINPGINIAAASGSSVVASEAGVVSLVSWLPSYGTIVIVEHRDGYRTVYGNLAGASVSRGASVRSGQKIGTVGGGWLHFEIWRDQTRLNPTTVLR